MKGDFTSARFDPAKHYNRVLKQQGRVELDSDWNEQREISGHLLRTLIKDLLGPCGGPVGDCGFDLLQILSKEAATAAEAEGDERTAGDFTLGAGRYYVDGLLVENERDTRYLAQPEWPHPPKPVVGRSYLVYLDVWERHVTYLEDDGIREVALGGPDTTTRVKTTWQVKLLEMNGGEGGSDEKGGATKEESRELAAAQAELKALQEEVAKETNKTKITELKRKMAVVQKRIKELQAAAEELPAPPRPAPGTGECDRLLEPLRGWTSGTMAARVEPSEAGDPPCVLPPESRYRGLENHLYRVEIHASGDTADANQVPTFKWSRENGSVASRWLETTGKDVRVASSRDLAAGQWVELSSEVDDLLGRPGPLKRITRVEGDSLTLEQAPALDKKAVNPRVRRWDQTANDDLALVEGAVAVVPDTWITLEDGVQVQFSAGTYRSGDYWLIPARVATGRIEWPVDEAKEALALQPRGIVHHYAPLFTVAAIASEPFIDLIEDCRKKFAPLPPVAT